MAGENPVLVTTNISQMPTPGIEPGLHCQKTRALTTEPAKQTMIRLMNVFRCIIAGIDLDGRIEEVEKFMKFFQKKIALMVSFGKSIPGFRHLCLDDQASLVKGIFILLLSLLITVTPYFMTTLRLSPPCY